MSALSILDQQLEDLADLPEFLVPPAGSYIMRIKDFSVKEIAGKEAAEVKLVVVSTQELTNPVDESTPETKAHTYPVADGTETSLAFMLDNEFGVGNLKRFTTPIAAALFVSTTRDAMEGSKGMELFMTTKVRVAKKDGARYFDFITVDVI